MNLDQRMHAFSITDPTLTGIFKEIEGIIGQIGIHSKFTFSQQSKKKYLFFSKNDIQFDNLDQEIFYEDLTSEGRILKEIDKKFHKSVRIWDNYEIGDSIAFTGKLLSDTDLFLQYIDLASNKQCFETMLKIFSDIKNELPCEYPKWFKPKDSNTIGIITAIMLERIICFR